jgi:hypothetical protein
MYLKKGPSLLIKILVWVVFIPVLAAWVHPCHEDCSKCEGSYAHSSCCGAHLIPGLASSAAGLQVLLSATIFHIFDQQFTQKILHSDIYHPPRA